MVTYVGNFASALFLKVAEPRVVRLLYFVIYASMSAAGLWMLTHPPDKFSNALGMLLLHMFASFISLGGVLCLIAVLPGVWWLERAGVIALVTGLAMYFVVAISLGGSVVNLAVTVSLICMFTLRWLEIRPYQLAPREE